jgi:phage repressor protein C with HTH and peptisase S24 domain
MQPADARGSPPEIGVVLGVWRLELPPHLVQVDHFVRNGREQRRNGEIVDYVSRPPHLAGATQAYAVYVVGSSMEPRYYAGELVHIHPGKPVTTGSFVLVQVRPESEGEAPRAFMKRLVRRTANKVTFEQFNPPKEIDIKASDILSMHRIVGSAESGGF